MYYGYIYKTVNKINNKLYIGKLKGYFNISYKGSGIILKRAIKKYGAINFTVRPIAYAKNKQELNKLECKYIKDYRLKFGLQKMYNIADGGQGGALFTGHHHSRDTKSRLRFARLGKKHTKETIMKLSRSRPHSKSCLCPFCKNKCGLGVGTFGFKGRVHSLKTKRAMSKARTLYYIERNR
jgi:group I intron endonuclease